MDILITWYLYQNHSDIDPGELTDLRSASVNNDNFALAAVRNNLHLHLQHCSGFLEGQISKYVHAVSESSDDMELLQSTKAPKVGYRIQLFHKFYGSYRSFRFYCCPIYAQFEIATFFFCSRYLVTWWKVLLVPY